jgi:8-oxo-dGTP pyrophosphatase MutT (NUDIX family)
MSRSEFLNYPEAPRANSIVVATTAFVRDHVGRVLLVRRADTGRWALPGGALDIGESVIECAVRETREESGIDIRVVGLVGIYSNPRHVIAYDDGEVRQQFSICLRAEPVRGWPTPSGETTDAGWFELAQLDVLDIHPEMRRRIDHGLAGNPTPHID